MVDAVTPWLQPEGFHTRERFDVGQTPSNATTIFDPVNHLTDDDYKDSAYEPQLHDRHGTLVRESTDDPQEAWGAQSRSWLTSGGTPWEAMTRQSLGGSHVTNYDAYEWAEDFQAAQVDAFFADPPPDLGGSMFFEWEGYGFFGPSAPVSTPGEYFGTFTNRQLQVRSSVAVHTRQIERDGAFVDYDVPATTVLALSPDTPPQDTGNTDPDYDRWLLVTGSYADYELGQGDEVIGSRWNESRLDKMVELFSIMDLWEAGPHNAFVPGVGTVAVQGHKRLLGDVGDEWAYYDIGDDEWETRAWKAGRFLDGATTHQFTNEGWALALGAPNVYNGEFGTPAADPRETSPWEWPERYVIGSRNAEVWLEGDYTPPRWRIRYESTRTSIPPRRIFPRSDGLTGGARRILGGGNTRQSGNRTLGSIL